jgi:hypothetical protein
MNLIEIMDLKIVITKIKIWLEGHNRILELAEESVNLRKQISWDYPHQGKEETNQWWKMNRTSEK